MLKVLRVFFLVVILFGSFARADVYELSFDRDLKELAMSGEHDKYVHLFRQKTLESLSSAISKTALGSGLTVIGLSQLIEAPGLKAVKEGIGFLGLMMTASIFAGEVLYDPSSKRTAMMSYKLAAEGLLQAMELVPRYVPYLWTISFIDYALTSALSEINSSYYGYWADVFDWYFWENEGKRSSADWYDLVVDVDLYSVQDKSSAPAPWNSPRFVEATNELWQNAQAIAGSYNQARSLRDQHWTINQDLLASVDRENFRQAFYINRLEGRIRQFHKEKLERELDDLFYNMDRGYTQMVVQIIQFIAENGADAPAPTYEEADRASYKKYYLYVLKGYGSSDEHLVLAQSHRIHEFTPQALAVDHCVDYRTVNLAKEKYPSAGPLAMKAWISVDKLTPESMSFDQAITWIKENTGRVYKHYGKENLCRTGGGHYVWIDGHYLNIGPKLASELER